MVNTLMNILIAIAFLLASYVALAAFFCEAFLTFGLQSWLSLKHTWFNRLKVKTLRLRVVEFKEDHYVIQGQSLWLPIWVNLWDPHNGVAGHEHTTVEDANFAAERLIRQLEVWASYKNSGTVHKIWKVK